MLEGNLERIWGHDLEGGGRGVGVPVHVGKSDVAATTDGPRIET